MAPDVPRNVQRAKREPMLKDARQPEPTDEQVPADEAVAPAGSLTFAQLLRPGMNAVRSHWRAFVLIQLVAAALVVGYFTWEPVTRFFGQLSRWREGGGLLFVSLSSVCAAVILPEVAKALTQRGEWRLNGAKLRDLGFLIVFFALHGLLVDGFYRLLAVTIGPGNDVGTLTIKTVIDMLLFGPLIAQPWTILAFDLRRNSYRIRPTLAAVSVKWYLHRTMPLQLPAWAFWTPMVVLIYALPPSLQIVLWTGAMGAWSLVMVFIGRGEEPD